MLNDFSNSSWEIKSNVFIDDILALAITRSFASSSSSINLVYSSGEIRIHSGVLFFSTTLEPFTLTSTKILIMVLSILEKIKKECYFV